jgi:hypothetical protein
VYAVPFALIAAAIAMPYAGTVITPFAGCAVDVAVELAVALSMPVTAYAACNDRNADLEQVNTISPLVPVGTAAINIATRFKFPAALAACVATLVADTPAIVAETVNPDVPEALTAKHATM